MRIALDNVIKLWIENIKKRYLITQDRHPNLPSHLHGQILLEEVVVNGRVEGWLTVEPEQLEMLLKQCLNPSERLDNVIPASVPKYGGRRLRDLSIDEFLDVTGWKKYLDKWVEEGLLPPNWKNVKTS